MLAYTEELLKIYNQSSDIEKIIYKELLDDILFFDGKNKKEIPNLGLNYFNHKYKDKLIKILYSTSVKKNGKKYTDNIIKNFSKVVIKEIFGTNKLGNYNTISYIPTKKIKYFNKEVNELISNKKISLIEYYYTRKILLDYFTEYKLIIKGLGEKVFDFKETFLFINELEKKNPRDPLSKLLNEIFKKQKELIGQEDYYKSLNELKNINEKIDNCRYEKKQVLDLLNKINGNQIIEFKYDYNSKTIYYNEKQIHKFETKKKENLKMNLLELIFKKNKLDEIKFNELYTYYGVQDYYLDINNDTVNKKIKSLIGKTNNFIKEKTGNNNIILISQIKKDNINLFYRNI